MEWRYEQSFGVLYRRIHMVDFGRARCFDSHYSNAHNATLPSRWIALFQAAMEALFWELYCFRISLFLFWMPMDCFVALWTPLFFEWFHQGFTGG
jgi:hypothetical protein